MRTMSIPRLRELLEYAPKTGILRWKEGRRSVGKGDVAGALARNGYLVIRVERVLFLAHRLAWASYYGEWPAEHLDHIDGDRLNNRISNLRIATQAENGQNIGVCSNNTSGIPGVSWSREKRKWRVSITVKRRRVHVGYFDDKAEAAQAHSAAKQRLHPFNPVQRTGAAVGNPAAPKTHRRPA